MPPRTPPTTAQIIDVLRQGYNNGNCLEEQRAVSLTDAHYLVRSRLRTTQVRAEQWLLAVVTAPDSELVLVEPRGEAHLRVSPDHHDGQHWMPVTAVGWTPEEAASLIIGYDGRPHRHTAGPGQFVLLRSSLEFFRASARDRVDRRGQEEADRQEAARAAFAAQQPGVLDTVQAFLRDLPGQVETRAFLPDGSPTRTSGADVPDALVEFTAGDYHPHTLTIQVRGPLILALADLLRASDAGTDAPRQPADR